MSPPIQAHHEGHRILSIGTVWLDASGAANLIERVVENTRFYRVVDEFAERHSPVLAESASPVEGRANWTRRRALLATMPDPEKRLGDQCGYDVRLTLVYAVLLMQGPSGLADQFQKGTRAGRRPVPYPVVGTLSLLLDFAVPGTLGVFWAPVSPLIGLAPSGIER